MGSLSRISPAVWLTLGRAGLPRVEQPDVEPGEVARVARDEGEPVDGGRRRHQAVDDRQRPVGAPTSPDLRDCDVDRQDTVVEDAQELLQPVLVPRRSFRVAPAQVLDASPDLAEY